MSQQLPYVSILTQVAFGRPCRQAGPDAAVYAVVIDGIHGRDPETGLPIFENVYKREDLYWGPHVERAPDLIVNPTPDDDDPRKNYAVAHNVPTKDMSFLDPSNLRTGNHTLDGIFIAFGDGVCRDVEIDRVSIMDLAPTVLYTMGLPVPEDMDGKILRDIFE